MMKKKRKILIVEGRFYDGISDFLLEGAKNALEKAGAHIDIVTVPGALEIPTVIRMAVKHYDGFVALGCVIRGETSHYDVVAGESARALMDLGAHHGVAIGNGILTCETEEQAEFRADPAQADKGAYAVKAVLSLLDIKDKFTG